MIASSRARASSAISIRRGAFPSTKAEFSGTIRSWMTDSLAVGVELSAGDRHRLCPDQDKGDEAGLLALVDPVVDSAALHDAVAGLELHQDAVIELHVEFA